MSKYSDDFRIEIKKGFLDAVGSMADYRIRLDAGGWVDKNVLTEEDYLEICRAVEAQYIIPEPPVVEDNTTTEGEISADDITGGVIEETEIIEDSTNEEVIDESTNETPKAEPTEPTE